MYLETIPTSNFEEVVTKEDFAKHFSNEVLDSVNEIIKNQIGQDSIPNKQVEFSIRKNIQSEVIPDKIIELIKYYKSQNKETNDGYNLFISLKTEKKDQLEYLLYLWKEFKTKIHQNSEQKNVIDEFLQGELENLLINNLTGFNEVSVFIESYLNNQLFETTQPKILEVITKIRSEYTLDKESIIEKLFEKSSYNKYVREFLNKRIEDFAQSLTNEDDPYEIMQLILAWQSYGNTSPGVKNFEIFKKLDIPATDRVEFAKKFRDLVQKNSSISWSIKAQLKNLTLE